MIVLEILDPPTGKARARGGPHGHYTPKATTNAETHVRAAWDRAGRPTLPARAPIVATVHMTLQRPDSHWKRDGELSAAGRHAGTLPVGKKPDVDNAAKLILDALEGYAYPADVAIVSLTVTKAWGTPASTRVMLDVVRGESS